MTPARLIISTEKQNFHDAPTNMAIDEAILCACLKGNHSATLRIYGWKTPALSIGLSQNPHEVLDLDRLQQEKMSFVRRPTGGGVIFHDHELTYSIVCAQEDIGSSLGVKASFEKITGFLIKAYEKLGTHALFAKEAEEPQNTHTIADFCLARKEPYDILIQGKKLGGSAQKRKKKIILQQGSIPLSFDKHRAARFLKNPQHVESLEITTLCELTQHTCDFDKLAKILTEAFCQHFQTHLSISNLSGEEHLLSQKLKNNKYAHPAWNLNRQYHEDETQAVLA
jgi:lipoate-protein ligase A